MQADIQKFTKKNGYGTCKKSRKQGWGIQKVTKYGVWNFEKLTRKKKMAYPGSYKENGDGTKEKGNRISSHFFTSELGMRKCRNIITTSKTEGEFMNVQFR